MRRLLVLLLSLSFAPLLFAEGTDLVVPDSPEEMEKTLGDNAPCNGCGLVTDVRHQASAPDQDPSQPYTIVEATVSSSETQVYENGVETYDSDGPTGGTWLITVRYDDGSYAVHESGTRPSVEQGDRVRVVSGQVVPL